MSNRREVLFIRNDMPDNFAIAKRIELPLRFDDAQVMAMTDVIRRIGIPLGIVLNVDATGIGFTFSIVFDQRPAVVETHDATPPVGWLAAFRDETGIWRMRMPDGSTREPTSTELAQIHLLDTKTPKSPH